MEEDDSETQRAQQIVQELEQLLTSCKLLAERAHVAEQACQEHLARAGTSAKEAMNWQERNAEFSRYIEESKVHAEAANSKIDVIQDACAGVQTQIARAQEEVARMTSLATEAAREASEASTASSLAHDEARQSAKAAHGYAEDLKKLADVAETNEKRVEGYEKRLDDLMTRCAKQQDEITRLLPGATSAQLASAYRERREAFVKPAWIWQGVFIAALATLIWLASEGLADTRTDAGTVRELSELARLWLTRLPIAGALIWLALHAAQEGALARRLEEDYGYKETVAASFQGFQEQMANISKETDADSALARLCNDVLATLASPPGRIYDKHALTAMPSDLVKKVVDGVADRLKSEGSSRTGPN